MVNDKNPVVLIVDDEKSVRESARDFLEDCNFKVLEAENGRIGLKIFNRKSPDLILIDLRMPEIDGLEVLRKVVEKSPETPAIVISGAGDIMDVIEALHLGAWDYLRKPIEDLTMLKHAIEKALERANLISENRRHQEQLEKEVSRRTRDLQRTNDELEQTAQALSQKEEKLRTLFETTSDCIWEMDQDGIFTFVNPRIKDLLGYDVDEIIETSIFDIIPDKEAERTKAFFGDKSEKPEPFAGWIGTRLHKDGREVIMEIGAAPMFDRDGKLSGWYGFDRDITDRVRAEEALRDSRERYRDLLETLSDWIWEVDAAGAYSHVSPKVSETLGYGPEELLGKPFWDIMPEEESNRVQDIFRELLVNPKPFRSVETTAVHKDGRKLRLDNSGKPFFDSRGKLIGYRGINRDITDRKQAEGEKARLQQQLQQAQKLEALGTLAGGIAHDFNNLLMGIQGRVSLMLIGDRCPAPHLEHLKGIESYVQSATNLTRQLLGFARGGKYEVRPSNMNELIKEQNRMFGRTNKEITIRGKYEKDIWPVDVDQGQIQQVLLNLYVNAAHAMPGGGSLRIQTENLTVSQGQFKSFSMKPGKYVKISVSDTGVGMDKATVERIFEPFFTTKEMGRGTGLGLASVYGIIKNHGGFIDVYSEKNLGSTFNIYLPASDGIVGAEDKSFGEVLQGQGTVLLVDDEDMIIDVGSEMIKSIGYEVLTAASGKEAVDIYKNNKDKIDMVILDMIMPDMGGGDTYDNLKEMDPKIKVLLSSGYSINGRAAEIIDRGCSGFIQKPFDLKGLSSKIVEVLDRE